MLSMIFFERDALAVICLAKELISILIKLLALFYYETNVFSMVSSSS
jgi:hypothetical protein